MKRKMKLAAVSLGLMTATALVAADKVTYQDDILPIFVSAKDDLALDKIEYHARVNSKKWMKFPVPGLNVPIGEKEVSHPFEIESLLRPLL